MRFTETELHGAYLIELDKHVDQRGFFARTWCRREFADHGLTSEISQCNVGYSHRAGTLRGIHFQLEPHAEAKLVRCVRGEIWDVIVDLRPHSSTFGRWSSVHLAACDYRMLFIPEGFGHGYQTLTDDVEIIYQTSKSYHPESIAGIRYDDPTFAITWPLPVSCVSSSDRKWPDFDADAWRDFHTMTTRGGT